MIVLKTISVHRGSKMSIKVNKTYEILISIILIFNLGFFYIGNLPKLTLEVNIIVMVMLYILFAVKKIIQPSGKTLIYFFILTIFISIEILRSNNLATNDEIFKMLPYTYVLMTIPFLDYIKRDSLSHFMKLLVIFDTAALTFRSLVWCMYNFFGMQLFSGIFDQRGRDWSKGTTIRISSTFLDGIVFAYLCYLLLTKNLSKKKKITIFLLLLIQFFYANYVYESRSQILCFLISGLAIYLVRFSKSSNKIIWLILGILASFMIYFSTFFQNMLMSFNINGSYGASTLVRFQGMAYFKDIFLEKTSNIFWGFGIDQDTHIVPGMIGKIYISDIGSIGYLFEYGIIGIIVSFYPFLMNIVDDIRKRNAFCMGVVVYILLSSIMAQNIFDSVRIIGVPFALAIFWCGDEVEEK